MISYNLDNAETSNELTLREIWAIDNLLCKEITVRKAQLRECIEALNWNSEITTRLVSDIVALDGIREKLKLGKGNK